MARVVNSYSSAYYRFTLEFNANGGEYVPSNVFAAQTTNAASVTLYKRIPNDIPTKSGYTFLGYATSSSGSVSKQPGDEITRSFSRQATFIGSQTYYEEGSGWITINEYQSEDQYASVTYYAQWELALVAPTITSNPEDVTVLVGEEAIISCSATVENGTLSYQWQYAINPSYAWYDIPNATASSYSIDTSNSSSNYYRVIVTNTLDGESLSTTSGIARVRVQNVQLPVFTVQPKSETIAIGETPRTLTALATSNAPITYQWKVNNGSNVWIPISGATSTSYVPPTNTVGTKRYYVTATASNGVQTSDARVSDIAVINVYEASTPVFAYDLSIVDETYNAGDFANTLNGTATATGVLTYQWQKSSDNGTTWYDIAGETSPTYTPSTRMGGVSKYRVIATSTAGTSVKTATSGIATITVNNVVQTPDTDWTQYLAALTKPFIKLARLDFLNPNGSVAFSLDNNQRNKRSSAFIQSGDLSVNMQNGPRRSATVTLANLNGDYDYNVNKLWFGQQVRLWEGMILPNGQDFYISQGVFYVKDPEEVFEPGLKQTTLNLVDKWAYLDGTLFGNLDGTYEVPVNSNIFNAIQAILDLDRGNGQKVDATAPVFTGYYNGKTTTLPDGSTVPLTNTPYTYRCDSENGTYADIILEFNTMLAGWVGYDSFGQLRLSPSQDDIVDQTKPVQWEFTPLNSTFLGATYSVKNSEVYNDIIIIGESLSEYGQTAGRATNYDPKSDTNANLIGLKTKRYQQSGYYTQDICESLAVFKLKRESVLKKSVSIKCSQMFHLQENNLVTIQRTDKPGSPIERHLITGFSRPIAQTGPMVINAVSVQDYPVATVTSAP